ncbi:hypothetical protein SAY86_001137 [Trapa natans]|uniref:Uncharacterized protein n=1 Tax=Trapa natans TaxID=22666 RepID=A0AAN7MD42_TRANT|nr:hypothetical protein SAY86_001137 [Trapa natans]
MKVLLEPFGLFGPDMAGPPPGIRIARGSLQHYGVSIFTSPALEIRDLSFSEDEIWNHPPIKKCKKKREKKIREEEEEEEEEEGEGFEERSLAYGAGGSMPESSSA